MSIWSKWVFYYLSLGIISYLTWIKQDIILMPMLLTILLLLFFSGPLLLGRWHYSTYRNRKQWRLPKKSYRSIWIFTIISLIMVILMPTSLLFLTLISAVMILLVGIRLWLAHDRFARHPTPADLRSLKAIRLQASLWWIWLSILLFGLMILLPFVFLLLWSSYL